MRYVEIEVDGKSKKLRYDFNALADLEQQAGAGVSKLFTEEMIGFHTIRLLFWAGLRHEDHGLTITQAGRVVKQMLDEGHSFGQLTEYITKALQLSGLFGEEEDVEKDSPFVPEKQPLPKESEDLKS